MDSDHRGISIFIDFIRLDRVFFVLSITSECATHGIKKRVVVSTKEFSHAPLGNMSPFPIDDGSASLR